MDPRPGRLLPHVLIGLLLAAAGLGALLGQLAPAVAIVATVQVLWLLWHGRAPRQTGTESRRSRRLAAQLRDLRSAAESMHEALVVIDAQGEVRWFNPPAQRLLGLAHPRDVGAHARDVFAGTELGEWLGGDAPHEKRTLAAPGKASAQLSVALIPYGSARQLLVARDVTDVVRLEQVRRDFVANVSHELRTPLTVIHGYLEILDVDDAPGLAPVLAEMRTQSMRMEQIVADLLTLSRLELEHSAPREPVDMAALLADLHREALALSHGRHHIFLDNRAPDLDLLGSPKDLRSAFSNLISNAVRYTPSGGRIAIRWQRIPNGASYSVVDTGHGISRQHIARLTERFYRVSSSRSRDSGGTGLGLSIVKHVLGPHSAQLRITSHPGKGSTFACIFPADRLQPHAD